MIVLIIWEVMFELYPFTGLAKVAGALANGPREAMGENLALVTPSRRRAAPSFGAFPSQDSVVASKKVCDGSTTSLATESECGTETSEVELFDKEKLTVAKKTSSTSAQLDDVGTTRSGFSGKLKKDSRSPLLSGLSRQSASRSPESALRLSQTITSCNPLLPNKRSLSPSQMNSSQGESRGKTKLSKSGGQSRMSSSSKSAGLSIPQERPSLLSGLPRRMSSSRSPDATKGSQSPTESSQPLSLSQSSLTNSAAGESREKASKSGGRSRMSSSPKAAELSNSREFDLASQIFTQSSSRASGSQKSSTQRSSYSQLSQLSGFRIPRQHTNGASNLSRAELDRAAGHIMGSLARSIMEGSAGMVKDYLDALGGNALGHD